MSIQRTFDASDPEKEIKQEIYDRFVHNYYYIGDSGRFFKYSDKWFVVQGTIPPRQYIAWREFVNIIGEEIFKKLTLSLNKNFEDEDKYFISVFNNYFPNSKNLMITLACGYFWKYEVESQRRKNMKEFFIKKLNNGCEVNIYTRDKDLKKYFLADKPFKKPLIKSLPFRMDIHYTIIQFNDKKERDKTLLIVEFPHTENTRCRLDAYFTIGQLKDLGCSDKNIKKLFSFLEGQNNWVSHFLLKSVPSRYFDTVINWKGL
jgi:hypothetical protein